MSSSFSRSLIDWQKRRGRHDLPWQQTRDPYAVWLSEIMLQQTRVATVIPYYRRFLARFPDVAALAAASLDEVLAHWSGLGYYARARNLHRAARAVVEGHGGAFPHGFDAILSLPGIGRSTAAAISVFAFGERRAILDGNVKRVLTRCFGIEGFPGDKRVETALWTKAEGLLPEVEIETYTQALMDLGATVCTRARPACQSCPLAADCLARREDRIGEFPAPRPRKALPEKDTTMLILLRGGEVLLERRPPAGVWGGLWSFPELPPGEAAEAHCRARFGAEVAPMAPLPILEHGFTHFRLRITPQPLAVTGLHHCAKEPGALWLSPEDARGAAIPAPVRKLLRWVSRYTDAGSSEGAHREQAQTIRFSREALT
jgi:A/G-specific adenine glycosylase